MGVKERGIERGVYLFTLSIAKAAT